MVAAALLLAFFAGISASSVLVSNNVASTSLLNANGWVVEDCDLSRNIQITFGIKQNISRLTETLNAVSYPSSPRYGQFLSNAEITQLISAPASSIDAVVEFLRQNNVNSYVVKSHGGYVVASVPASVASVMFETPLHSLRNSNTNQTVSFHSLQGLSLPEELAEIVVYLSGISTSVPSVLKPRVTVHSGAGATTVTDLKNLYSIPQTYNITNGNKATQSVAEFQFQFFDPADTELFFEKYSTNNVGRTVAKINGTNRPSTPAAEASLDVEYIMAMGSNSSTTFYYVNDGAFLTSLIDFFIDLNTQSNPEKVVSVSFGTNGDESWDTVNQLDTEIQKLGVKGVTVMFASGDNGVGCQNGRNEPDFPNSPHILMVGATDVGPTANTEISAKLSSGGFSDDYPIQDWQSADVQAFFAAATAAGTLPPAAQYNKSGRGFPDIAAIGVNLPIIVGGKTESGSGTSFSSPIVAGIISLLNDLRVGAGKATLGWFNPLLYQIHKEHPEAFQDITSGPRNADGSCQGFAPQAGWDPVTGLGTLNFQVLQKIINNY